MNLIDGLILGCIALGLGYTVFAMRKSKRKGCSGTCLGCAQETSCQIKNFKKDYDKDHKSRCHCG